MSSESTKLAVVTGAGSVIGREVARFLSERGARIIAAGRRLEALEETAELCGGDVACVSADLATDEGCAKLAKDADGEVAYLFHGAGRMPFQSLAETDRRTWRQILGINLSGRLFLT